MSRDDSDYTVIKMGRAADGKAVVLITGDERDSMLRSVLGRIRDSREDIFLDAIHAAEDTRDDFTSTRGELKAAITRLASLLRQEIGEDEG